MICAQSIHWSEGVVSIFRSCIFIGISGSGVDLDLLTSAILASSFASFLDLYFAWYSRLWGAAVLSIVLIHLHGGFTVAVEVVDIIWYIAGPYTTYNSCISHLKAWCTVYSSCEGFPPSESKRLQFILGEERRLLCAWGTYRQVFCHQVLILRNGGFGKTLTRSLKTPELLR